MKRLLTLVAVLALLVSACASSDDGLRQGLSEEPPPIADQPDSEPSPTDDVSIPVAPRGGSGEGADGSEFPGVSPDLAGEIDQALADLAARLGDDRAISVTVAHELTWPDGSLGCPQPGVLYTQALVDGYRIELTDGVNLYQYHGERGRPPFYCANGFDSG